MNWRLTEYMNKVWFIEISADSSITTISGSWFLELRGLTLSELDMNCWFESVRGRRPQEAHWLLFPGRSTQTCTCSTTRCLLNEPLCVSYAFSCIRGKQQSVIFFWFKFFFCNYFPGNLWLCVNRATTQLYLSLQCRGPERPLSAVKAENTLYCTL